MPLSPCCHFERKREIFFVCDQSRHGRTADNGKHRTPCDVGSRCFMQTALRRETGNEKRKRSLGCARDDETREGYFPFLFIPLRKPTSAPLEHLLPEEGGRYENAVFPVSSFRAKARNLFRLRSSNSCEGSGERETPCFIRLGSTVLHADQFAKGSGNGKRKRSLGCARVDEPGKRFPPISFQPTSGKPTSAPSGHLLPEEGGRMSLFLYRHFLRKSRLAFCALS